MKTRQINGEIIEDTVKELCVEANTVLRQDVLEELKSLYRSEDDGTIAKKMAGILIENADIAREEGIPICQDTGMLTVFIDMGRDVIISGGAIEDAVNKGVEKAYRDNHFRKSVVEDPLKRKNTGTNTPAIIHIDITGGNKLGISVMPKGFGSENKSRIFMLNPTSDSDEIADRCVEAVKAAGPDACPPYILGIGLGGTMESCALMAKKALLRPINKFNPKEHIAELERKIKERTDTLGIGVMGFGGPGTVIGVNIEAAPTHIAGLPVAINVSCHALRSASRII